MLKSQVHEHRLGDRVLFDEVFAGLIVGLGRLRSIAVYDVLLENGHTATGVVPGYLRAWPVKQSFPAIRAPAS